MTPNPPVGLFSPMHIANVSFDIKIVIPYQDEDGTIRGEELLAIKTGDYYQIKSIPLYASRIAVNDILQVREREGVLYFQKIIQDSKHSVIQMVIIDRDYKDIINQIRHFGCRWQWSNSRNLMAFDIPKEMPYPPIKEWLDKGEEEQRWAYRIACLSHK